MTAPVPDNGWIHPGSDHPARPFAEWLNDQRMKDVSQVFHEIMARYCQALNLQPRAESATDWRALARVQSAKLAVALDEPGAEARLLKVMNSPDWKGNPSGRDELVRLVAWVEGGGSILDPNPEPLHKARAVLKSAAQCCEKASGPGRVCADCAAASSAYSADMRA